MPESARSRIVMLCTGNAARSVMGAVMLRTRHDGVDVVGAGTHALEGLPMSGRTRLALSRHGLADADHRSHQLVEDDLKDATLVVAFAPEHVAYVRRTHPEAADRTATLHHLVDALSSGEGSLSERVTALALGGVGLEGATEVVDPAGGDETTFIECADEISALIDRLLERL